SAAHHSVHATPSSKVKGVYYEHEPATLIPRRGKLVRDLHNKGLSPDFIQLVVNLGLVDVHTAYEANVPESAFESLVDNSLVVRPNPAPGTSKVKPQTADSSEDEVHESEVAYVDTFKRLLDSLSSSTTIATLPPDYRKTLYVCKDNQTKRVQGSELKPDLALYREENSTRDISRVQILFEAKQHMNEETAYKKYLGQFADYALEIWKTQPLRTFVPLLMLLGCNLYLAVFTRRGYYTTTIGQVMCQRTSDLTSCRDDVLPAIRTLWFLLTLPPSNIGQLNTSIHSFNYVDIKSIAGQAVLEVVPFPSDSSIEVGSRIPQSIPIVGRCAHLFKARYGNMDVVLKISSTPINRLPEGAIYEVLATKDDDSNPRVSGIPRVHSSGILANNIDGYRVEYVLMKDCGTTVVKYFDELRASKLPAADIVREARKCVESVMETLAQARHVSVLHRDLSPGNIAIKGGRTYVIDWGYAKLLCPPSEPLDVVIFKHLDKNNDSFKTDLASRWGLDWDKVMSKETNKDPFTGTSMYMSTQMLLQVKRRSIFNDIESVFYVILDALSTRDRSASAEDSPPGFAFFASNITAFTRIGLLGCDRLCFADFGVKTDGSQALEDMLCGMHRFLFFSGDRYIGGYLRDEYERQFDRVAAASFMNAATIQLLDGEGDAVKPAPNSPQRCGPEYLAPNAPEQPVASSSRPHMELQMPVHRDSTIGDSSSSDDGENTRPLKNVANVLDSPTPRASQNRGRGRAIVAQKLAPRTLAPRTRGVAKPRAQARSAASTTSSTLRASNSEPGNDATILSGGVAEGGSRRVTTRSSSLLSASSVKRSREGEPDTTTGRRLKHKKPSSQMDVDST
ncbi:hypothetical protein H4S03_008502, partial [Coemansia sp. S3946]